MQEMAIRFYCDSKWSVRVCNICKLMAIMPLPLVFGCFVCFVVVVAVVIAVQGYLSQSLVMAICDRSYVCASACCVYANA